MPQTLYKMFPNLSFSKPLDEMYQYYKYVHSDAHLDMSPDSVGASVFSIVSIVILTDRTRSLYTKNTHRLSYLPPATTYYYSTFLPLLLYLFWLL